MKIISFSLLLTLILNSFSFSNDNSDKTYYDTNAHNDLFNQFKEYSDSKPSLRRGSWTENLEPPSSGSDIGDLTRLWVISREFVPGYNSERGFFIAEESSLDLGLKWTVLNCLKQIAEYTGSEISGKNDVMETRVNSKLFGLSILGNQFMDRNTFKLNYEIKLGTRSLKYSYSEKEYAKNEFDVKNEIQENGLPFSELLKYLYHHANVSLHLFKQRGHEKKVDSYGVIIITKITGQSSSRYRTRGKMWEGTFDGGKLMEAVAWKPDGKKCPISLIKNGYGVLVCYDENGNESYRSIYYEGEGRPQFENP